MLLKLNDTVSSSVIIMTRLRAWLPDNSGSISGRRRGLNCTPECSAELLSQPTSIRLLLCVRGVFKKRQNFLNNTPTSFESALWLLSTHSVWFWQQTAICPISLRALVVELHPLNWVRARAVCRISDNVTMKELEEQRLCVKIFCTLGKHFTETFNLFIQA
jgi:hypothetical protein